MTLSRRPRSRRRYERPAAAYLVTVALAASATFTVQWAGPAASASDRQSQPRASASPSHRGWVKYYIVQQPKKHRKEFLYEIAVKTLGNGNLALKIFKLNKGRLQPGGRRLERPTVIEPGWILVLPANASGPSVHYGPLPVVTPKATPSAAASPTASASAAASPTASPTVSPTLSARPRASGVAGAARARQSRYLLVSKRAVIVGCAILIALLLVAGLMVVLRRRRKARATVKPGGDQVPALPAGARPTAIEVAGDLPWPAYLSPGVSHPAGPGRSGRMAPGESPAAGPAGGLAAGPVLPALPAAGLQAAPLDNAVLPPRPAQPRSAPPRPLPQNPLPQNPPPPNLPPAPPRLSRRQGPAAQRTDTAGPRTSEHEVAFGDDRIRVVLAEAPAITQEGTPRNGRTGLDVTPYLVWTPLPYDIPDDGVAFACLGAGEQGCLFIDLGAAPGTVAIGGNNQAAVRLAESIAHQLCTAVAAGRGCVVVVIGDALPTPPPSGAVRVASLRELGSALPQRADNGTEIVFCQLRTSEDMLSLERYASGARHHVVPVVLASRADAPWSFTAQPSRRPIETLHTVLGNSHAG